MDSTEIATAAALVLKILESTLGPERRPPNEHPAEPTRHEFPGAPGTFTINDTLEAAEYESLVKAAEAFGTTLYNRLVHLLPQTVHGGAVKTHRFKIQTVSVSSRGLVPTPYRWAWSSSALNSNTSPPSYVYDSDPTVYSRLTFLIYLNDDFDGGCTTFFLPSSTYGILEARPVKPRTGTVYIFPYGAAKGSLLHEGSGVIQGAKYIIRTEVLYEVDQSQRVDAAKD